jgi:hypothetical protein
MAEHDLSPSAIGFAGAGRRDAGWNISASEPGRSVAYRLDIHSQAVASGLRDAATHHQIYLFLVDGMVFGREGLNAATAESGEVVFVLSVDASGQVSRDQHRAIASPGTLASPDLITLTAIVTDNSGAVDCASAKIGGTLEFVVQPAERRRNPRGRAEEGQPAGRDEAPLADIIYELSVAAAGADTGLVDAATRQPIFLFTDGPEIAARLGKDAMAAASGEVAFVISVDGAGNVLLDQKRDVVAGQSWEAPAAALSIQPDLVRLKACLSGTGDGREVAYANIAGTLCFGERGARAALSRAMQRDAAQLRLRQAEKSQAPHTIM